MSAEGDYRRVGSPRIAAVVLDYGEVLCHRPSCNALARMAAVFGVRTEDFLSIYRSSRNPYDRGDVSPRTYWTEFARQAGTAIHSEDVERLRRWDVEMWSSVNGEMTDWLAQIHAAGFRTAILSNMQTDMATHARRTFDWLRYIDHQIFSCEIRSIKPDSAIYRHTLAKLGVPKTAVLFVDDREENVQAARGAGIQGIRFESVPQFRGQLLELGFPILPRDGATDASRL